jgi:hypothetical protein
MFKQQYLNFVEIHNQSPTILILEIATVVELTPSINQKNLLIEEANLILRPNSMLISSSRISRFPKIKPLSSLFPLQD